MTREIVKRKIDGLLDAALGAELAAATHELEKAIDELIAEETQREVQRRVFPGVIDPRQALAERVLLVLVAKDEAETNGFFNDALAGRAVAYADALIKTLRERKAT